MFTQLLRDLRFAARSFAKRPGFTGVVVLTLALGIGCSVAIFSVANAVLFRPLPYGDPEELALVWTRLPATNVERSLVSGPDLGDYVRETTLFEGFAGAVAFNGTLTGDGPAEQITTSYASWNLFDVLDVEPFLGRTFREDDAFAVSPDMFGVPNPDLPPGTVVLTHGFWQRRFGSDPDVLGRTIQLDGFGSVIVGVLPPDFGIYLPADVAMPTNIDAFGVLPSNISEFARDAPWLTVVTRLKDGVTLEQARQEMNALAARLREVHQFHANQNLQIDVHGMHDDVVSHARPGLLALLGAVGLVLLIACGNVANLLLVRASAREREISVRAALGSGHARIIRQMLTESVVLATAGAVLGVVLAWLGVEIITTMSPGNLPRVEDVAIDGSVLLFTAGVTLLAAITFGLAPAFRAVAGNLANALKDRGSDSGGVRGNKLRTGLVVSEVALSLVLLISAGLLWRSFAELQRIEPGFDAENVVTFTSPLLFTTYYNAGLRATFVNDLGRRISEIPGVEGVGGSAPLPLAGGELYSVGSYGRPDDTDETYQANKADFKAVLPGFFETLDIDLVAGRTFLPSDNEPEAQPVVIIDEKLALRVFGNGDVLGRELIIDHFSEETFSMGRLPVVVVGVVGNVRASSLAAEGRETIYVPYLHYSFLPMTYVVRTRTDPSELVAAVRGVVAAMDPDIPVSGVSTLETYVSDAMAPTRFMLALIGVFASVALVLASLGLYGVIAYSVRQRTREFGVRIAFGAGDGDVVGLVLRQGVLMALGGIAIGLGASFTLRRVVESLLVGVSATDPITYAGVPMLLLAIAVLACYVPARRATSVDPVAALRDE